MVLLEKQEAYYPPSLKKLYKYLSKKGIKTSFENFNRVYFEVRDKFYSESRASLEEPHFNLRISQTLQKLGYDYKASDPIVIGATEAFADEFMCYASLDPDAPDVLRKLHTKHKLGLISNFAIPECCWKLLEKFGLKRFFDTVIISGEINRRKPSAEIFEKALKSLAIEAEDSVFVGDMWDLDVIGPKKVGMKTVFIKRRPTQEIENIKPDKIITQLSELLTVLEDC